MLADDAKENESEAATAEAGAKPAAADHADVFRLAQAAMAKARETKTSAAEDVGIGVGLPTPANAETESGLSQAARLGAGDIAESVVACGVCTTTFKMGESYCPGCGHMQASEEADCQKKEETEPANRRDGLNHKPAWMTRGLGINKEFFGETTGDLMKPGLYKADLERLERAVPTGPDPFGDVFREVVSVTVEPTSVARSPDEAGSENGELEEEEPEYDPFSEEPSSAEKQASSLPVADYKAISPQPLPISQLPPVPAKSPPVDMAFVAAPPGPPPEPPPGHISNPPGPPEETSIRAQSKTAQTKSAAAVQSSKNISVRTKSSMLTKSAGVLKASGAVAKCEVSAPALAPLPVKMPPPRKADAELVATAKPPPKAKGAHMTQTPKIAAEHSKAPPVSSTSMPKMQGPLPGPVVFQPPLGNDGAPAPPILPGFAPNFPIVPAGLDLLAPGMPILPPLPPELIAAMDADNLSEMPILPPLPPELVAAMDAGNLAGLGAVPLPMCLPPMQLLAGMPHMPAGFDATMLVHWETHLSPQGAPYYYCKASGESRWIRPAGPADVVIDMGASAPPLAPKAPDVKTALGEPESWETIGRTGWLRVETEKGFRYFYHKKKKITSWECPKEIAKEVAELDGVLGNTPAESPDKAEGNTEVEAATEPKPAEESVEDETQPVKLTKAERIEKKEEEQKVSKEKQRLLNFKQLMMEKGVKAFDKYETWLPKLLHDPRFTAVPGQKARKELFQALAKRIDNDRKKAATEKKRNGREVFKELIVKAENAGSFQDCTASSILQVIEKKYGDDERWLALPEKDRNRMITEAFEEFDKKRQKELAAAKSGFRDLIMKTLKGRDRFPKWQDIKRKLQEDVSWEPVGSSAERENIYDQVVKELDEARRKKAKRQRQDENEVTDARKKRRLSEAEENLMNLFTERVKQPFSVEWEDVRDMLREHTVLRKCELSKDEQERVWKDYRKEVAEARCRVFTKHLKDMPADVIGPEMDFEEVLKKVLDGGTKKAFNGMPEDLMRSAWEDWREQAHDSSVEICKQWLRSCEHFREALDVDPKGGPQFEALLEQLKQADVRFRRLAKHPEDQRRLVTERLKELQELRSHARMEEDD